jgi:hypothetical protein
MLTATLWAYKCKGACGGATARRCCCVNMHSQHERSAVLQQDRTLQRNQLAYFGFARVAAGCSIAQGSGLEYAVRQRLASAQRGDASVRRLKAKIEQTLLASGFALIVGQPDEGIREAFTKCSEHTQRRRKLTVARCRPQSAGFCSRCRRTQEWSRVCCEPPVRLLARLRHAVRHFETDASDLLGLQAAQAWGWAASW